MNKKISNLLTLLFIGVLFASFSYTSFGQKSQKPNILFILVDDMGYGDLGVLYQNQRAKANDRSEPWEFTPNLDKLARQGAVLTDQYCAAPVCAPSRASILSGRSQGHTDVRDNQFDKALEDNYTLASVLKTAGYSTAAFGKWGLQGLQGNFTPPDWPAHPLHRGFDYFLGYIRHKDGHEHYPKEGLYDGPKEVWKNRTNIASELDKCYTADLWTAAAKKWIIDHEKGKASGKPFFIYLAYDTPHAVLELPAQAYPEGGGIKGGLQWTGKPGHMINTASGTVDSWIYPDYAHATYDDDHNPGTPEVAWPKVYKRYATATRRIDNAVGDIMHLLRDLKIDKNTMIVFSSDNGPSRESYLPRGFKPNNPSFFRSFGPFDGIKRDCWEGGLRMPVLASWPGHIPAGRTVSLPSISYDWLATFTDMAGLPAPAITDGVSLLPSLTGRGKQQTPLVYVEYFQSGHTPDYKDFAPLHRGRKRGQMQLIRFGDFVGVRYNILSQNDNFEIYDVTKDPQELNNLAGKPAFAKMQQQMKTRVLQVRMPNSSAPRPYDDELVPAVASKKTLPGVVWKAFNGNFSWVPDVTTLTSVKNGFSKYPAVNILEKTTNGAVLFYGYLNIPKDGDFSFFIRAGTGALLRIHDATVVDAGYGYHPMTERNGKIRLKAGLHPFKLYCLQRAADRHVLQLTWSGPGISRQPIPANIFCRDVEKK